MIPPIYAKLLELSDIEPLLINLAKALFSNGIDFYIDEEGSFKSEMQGVRSNNPLINKHNEILLYMAKDETMPSLSAYVSGEYPNSIFHKFQRAWGESQDSFHLKLKDTKLEVVEGGIKGPNFLIFSKNPIYDLNKILLDKKDLSLVEMEFQAIDGNSYTIKGACIHNYSTFEHNHNLKIILPYNIQCRIITNLVKSY